ncbi:hypothetical protein QSV08_03045 [Maribacter sp. BPC-D8]|uniref:hypothetical protein n=1 Tax=Maribacter sp. BPC-D8 TaxID=3053613 RepID=UPI002B4721C5|nr:hypothetical protein [Maribacter sp. BPC-D8]WRI30220.1 hypothetical protein QSV08_03045 [Maribacter sp. BPC-D8]
MQASFKNEQTDSEIYFASKRINEGFSEQDTSIIEYVAQFLERDSIKVVINHSIDNNVDTFYLSGNQKLDFFNTPETYTDQSTRRKSDYFDVKGNCYEFNTEAIAHNSVYLKKLCFTYSKEQISLSEIYLLDGD